MAFGRLNPNPLMSITCKPILPYSWYGWRPVTLSDPIVIPYYRLTVV